MRSELFGLLLGLVLAIPASAQQTQTTPTTQQGATLSHGLAGLVYSPPAILTAPVRDSQAVTIVQNAVTAMGGAAISALQDCTVQARATMGPRAQISNGIITWRFGGGEFRIDALGPNGPYSLMTGHGKPGVINGSSQAVPTYVTQAIFVPVAVASILAQEITNPKMSLRFKDNETLGTESVAVVTTALEMDYPDNVVTPQTWYFDAATNLPVRVEYRAPDMKHADDFVPAAMALSSYQAVSGVAFPYSITSTVNGQNQAAFTVQSVVLNSGIPASQFDGQFVSTGGAK